LRAEPKHATISRFYAIASPRAVRATSPIPTLDMYYFVTAQAVNLNSHSTTLSSLQRMDEVLRVFSSVAVDGTSSRRGLLLILSGFLISRQALANDDEQ